MVGSPDSTTAPTAGLQLEWILRIDAPYNLANDQAMRAGFNGSGASNNNRLIERHTSDLTGGAYWKSYDFKPLRERQPNRTFREFPERDLFGRPLGPRDVMPNVCKPFVLAGGKRARRQQIYSR